MLLASLLVPAAFALANFPGELEADLGMPCAATCDLCHSSASGGGSPTQDFGVAMGERGMSSSTSSLGPALDAMAADGVDSDGDGVIDTEALAQGLNPNSSGDDFCPDGGADGSASGPSYGCLSVVSTPNAGLLGLALGLLAALRRRRSLDPAVDWTHPQAARIEDDHGTDLSTHEGPRGQDRQLPGPGDRR